MKKILIALPLVLIMILSMVPVMAAFDNNVSTEITVYPNPLKPTEQYRTEVKNIALTDVEIAKKGDDLKKYVKAEVEKLYNKANYAVTVDSVEVYHEGKDAAKNTVHLTVAQAQTLKIPGEFNKSEDRAGKYLHKDAKPADITGDEGNKVLAKSATTDNIADAYVIEEDIPADPEVQASAKVSVKAKCAPPDETKKDEHCPVLCDYITVKLYDVYNKEIVDFATKSYEVKKMQVPDQAGILKHYMNNFFPANDYQVLKGWNLQDEIWGMMSIEDCTIQINVLPLYAQIQIVHELYDCCITPGGDYKYELWRSFVEDDEKWNRRDGLMEIPFLDFHTDLMINQDKAAEYAKTRLEKINAKDFVFQGAKFYDGINLSGYMTGKVVDFQGKVATIKNGIPTIVLTYYRGECVKPEETEAKVDDAKLVAGAETTNAPAAQQLPATGAKDVTAFFMSAVALLGLGIFFAKKH